MNITTDQVSAAQRLGRGRDRGKPPLTPLAIRLRTLREQAKLPQVEVAVAVGIDRSSLSKLETAEDVPGRELLMALATFYSVSLDWLTSGFGDPEIGKAAASNQDEALLLFGFRQLPEDEAKAYLGLLMSRIKPKGS